MYCPKCGTHNPARKNYCRGCGEDLRLVAQAVKKSLPVKLAAKVDVLMTSKSERFRRDCLLLLLLGLGSAVTLLWAALGGDSILFPALLTGFAFVGALWEGLAYKHSLTLRKELDAWDSTPFASADKLTVLGLTGKTANKPGSDRQKVGTLRLLYCPKCGTGGKEGVSFCSVCGTDLQSVKGALGEGAVLSWFGQQLDRYVRRRSVDEEIGQLGKKLLYTGPLLLFFSIAPWAAGGALGRTHLVLGAIYIFIGLWDSLVYRRRLNLEGDVTSGEEAGEPAELPRAPNTAQPLAESARSQVSGVETAPFSIVEEPTRKMDRERE
jgi:hypothetical protein